IAELRSLIVAATRRCAIICWLRARGIHAARRRWWRRRRFHHAPRRRRRRTHTRLASLRFAALWRLHARTRLPALRRGRELFQAQLCDFGKGAIGTVAREIVHKVRRIAAVADRAPVLGLRLQYITARRRRRCRTRSRARARCRGSTRR